MNNKKRPSNASSRYNFLPWTAYVVVDRWKMSSENVHR